MKMSAYIWNYPYLLSYHPLVLLHLLYLLVYLIYRLLFALFRVPVLLVMCAVWLSCLLQNFLLLLNLTAN